MSDKKYIVGYPDGSGICGGRSRTTRITCYCSEAGMNTTVVEVHYSEEYDCTEMAKGIADHLNKGAEGE